MTTTITTDMLTALVRDAQGRSRTPLPEIAHTLIDWLTGLAAQTLDMAELSDDARRGAHDQFLAVAEELRPFTRYPFKPTEADLWVQRQMVAAGLAAGMTREEIRADMQRIDDEVLAEAKAGESA